MRHALWVGITAWVAGCGASGPDGLLADYGQRVGRVLDRDVTGISVPATPAYPRHRDRALPSPDVRVGVGDALALRPCLGRLIGERNSILGQVMAPSTRLSYESRFAEALAECATEAPADSELAEVLDAVAADKARALAVAGWNAAFDSEAVADFLAAGAAPIALTADPGAISGLDALTDLAALVRRGLGGEAIAEAQIEAVLQRLRGSRGASTILAAAGLLIAHLDATTASLHARLDARALCLQPQPTRDARIAETVFQRVYAGQVQPYLSAVMRALTRLNDALADLLAVQRVAARPAIVVYVDAVAARRLALRDASRRHAEAWQRLLGQCGLMPGR